MLIIAAGIWAYHNSFQGPFIFDDVTSIAENPHIRHLWPVWEALTPPHKGGETVGGRPLVNLSLAINYAIHGLRVAGYHAVNLAIHIIAGLVLYGVVRRTLLQPPLRPRFGQAALPLALIIAVIWVVHPLQTESVTYIVQRAESMMGLFYLLTLYCFIRGVESQDWPRGRAALRHGVEGRGPAGASPSRSLGWFCLSVASCLLGMASKEVMVSAPLLVLLYDRTFLSGSFIEAWQRRGQLYLALAATWILLAYLVITTGTRGGTAGIGAGLVWQAYATTQLQAVTHYLRLSLWPHPLVFDYGTVVASDIGEVLSGALIVAAMLIGTLVALRRWTSVGFLGVWFFAILAPTSSLVPVASQTIAEHRLYLPLAAVVAALVLGAFGLGKRLFNKRQGVVLACVAGGAVVVLFTFMTIQRNQQYNSALTIWQDTVEKRPNNPRAHGGLGEALVQLGELQEAIRHYEQALRIRPEYAETHINLGAALEKSGHTQEAIAHYEQALRIKPDFAKAHYNWGLALQDAGQVQQATSHYEQALQAQPDFAEAHNSLGAVLMGQGRLQEAVRQYEQALRINPENAEANYNLGIALVQMGRLEEAIEHWKQALQIKPDNADAHYNWGLALVRLGQLPEAIEHWNQALRINPNLADAHYNWGIALERLGRAQEAIQHYEQALRIKPDYA